METEKVCVNLSAVELGSIDVLVAQGHYTNRSDVIRAGVRAITGEHEQVLAQATRRAGCLGVMTLGKKHLEKSLSEGQRMKVFVIGILRLDGTITPELADQAFEQIRIIGALKAKPEVLARLQDRITHGLEVA